MSKKVVIQPVTRVEGHAKITVSLDDAGRVTDTKVQVVELRGFENFCIGRPVEEMPRIVTRICGVCPWAHHVAAGKAADAVFQAEVPETGRKLRELAYMAHFVHSHLLHFFFLSGADFLAEPDMDYHLRNIIGLSQKNPQLTQQVVRVRKLAQQITEIMAGKAIHPDVVVPGGFSKPLGKEQRDEIYGMAKECLDFTRFALDFAKKKVFAPLLPGLKEEQALKTGFLGMVGPGGGLDFYDGKLRLMKTEGDYQEFDGADYLDYIGEHAEDWTFMKFPYDKSVGSFSMDPDHPVGIYRTNSLARLNVCDFIPTALAQKELEEFRGTVGRIAQHTFLYHWARLIEALYAAERMMELLEDPALTDPYTRNKVEPCGGRGVGIVEAPRGTLIHDYQADAKGMIEKVNLIVGTTHNNAAINISAFRAARKLLENGDWGEEALNKIEMAIRAYDPCFSCATHKMDGSLAVQVELRDQHGNTLKTLQN